MPDSKFDELKKRSLQRQRFKINLNEHETSIRKLMDLDVSLPVILEWLVEEKQIATTLPALRRFIRRTFGEPFYDSFTARNGWKKSKLQKITASSLVHRSHALATAEHGNGKAAESPAVSSSFESMLDGKQRDDFTKQYLPINPLFTKGK